jgi:hypothetical protein
MFDAFSVFCLDNMPTHLPHICVPLKRERNLRGDKRKEGEGKEGKIREGKRNIAKLVFCHSPETWFISS